MKNSTLTFEVSKQKLFNSIVLPLVISQLLVGALIVSIIAFLVTKSANLHLAFSDDLIRGMFQSMGTAYLFVLSLITYVVCLLLNQTAHKLVIADDSLEFSSLWQTRKFRWKEIAKVDVLDKGWRKYLFVKTWDAEVFILAPPLAPRETLETEVKARAFDALDAPPRQGQRSLQERKRELLWSEIMTGIKQIFTSICLIFAGFGSYIVWQEQRPPDISIPQFGEFESPLALGKKMWIDAFRVANYGRETRGIRFEISGDALDSHLLQNPIILIDTVEETQLSFPSRKRHQTRELIPLEHTKSGVWVGESKSTVLPHENNYAIKSVFFMTEAMSGGDPWERQQTMTLFADVLKKGKGNLKLDVAAKNSATVSLKLKVATSIEEDGRATPIASVGVPSSFPLPAYPGSIIDLLSAWDIRLYADEDPKEVTQFYKDELRKRGWRLTEEKSPNKRLEANLVGRKGKDKIRVEITKDWKQGSQIEITLNFM